MSSKHATLGLCLAGLFLWAGCGPKGGRTLLATHGKVWTGDPTHPQATAFVVRVGKFLYVGDDRTAADPAAETEAPAH